METNDIVDLSEEFCALKSWELSERLSELKNAREICVTINWVSKETAWKLKGFLEMKKPEGQTRRAAIRATKAQMDEAPNVFASGVEWIEVKKEL